MVIAAGIGLAVAPLAQAGASEQDILLRMLAGQSALQGKKLAKAIARAEASPLGSEANPVRVTMPPGERAYLDRLRCSDGAAPAYVREGSVGTGPFGNIVDLYRVTCAGGQPASAAVYMDMYHGGFAEPRPVPGFSVAP